MLASPARKGRARDDRQPKLLATAPRHFTTWLLGPRSATAQHLVAGPKEISTPGENRESLISLTFGAGWLTLSGKGEAIPVHANCVTGHLVKVTMWKTLNDLEGVYINHS